VLGTRTGRPSDAPISLVCADARRRHPTFRLNRWGEMAPDYLSLWRAIGSKAIERISEGRTLTKWPWFGSDGEVPLHCRILLPFGSSLRVSNYRRRFESVLAFPGNDRLGAVALLANSSSRGVNGFAVRCYACSNHQSRRTTYVAVCSKWVTLAGEVNTQPPCWRNR